MSNKRIKVTIECGNRGYWEVFSNRDMEDQGHEGNLFDYWSPLSKVKDSSRKCENHPVYGYMECLFQSNSSPSYLYDEKGPMYVSVEHVND